MFNVDKLWNNFSNQTKGTLLCVVGTLILSPDTLLLRKVSSLDGYVVQFYRYFISGTIFLMLVFALNGHQGFIQTFRDLKLIGLIAGLVFGLSNFLFTEAVQCTAVANVLVINATNSAFSAILSYFLFGETIDFKTFLTIIVCFGSITLIFADNLTTSGGGKNDTKGIVFALFASITFGSYFAILRFASKVSGKEPDMLGCNVIAMYFVALLSLCLGANIVKIDVVNALYLCINGIIVLPLSFWMLTVGPSLISAPEVSLFTEIETILGPVWVYLGGYESPPKFTLIGGLLLLSSLSIHSLLTLREMRNKNKENKDNEKYAGIKLNDNDNKYDTDDKL